MAKIVIFGVGDTAELVHFYLHNDTEHKVVAFTLDSDYIDSNSFCKLPLVAFECLEKEYPPNDYKVFIALGYSKVNNVRKIKYYEAIDKGYALISYISPRATIFDNVQIGNNCLILEDSIVQPFVRIGNNVSLWSGNHIGHHSRIDDHCFLASQTCVSGRVCISECSFIGANATIRDHITIGRKNVIGAGSIIMHDTNDDEVYVPERTKLYNKKSYELEKI